MRLFLDLVLCLALVHLYAVIIVAFNLLFYSFRSIYYSIMWNLARPKTTKLHKRPQNPDKSAKKSKETKGGKL